MSKSSRMQRVKTVKEWMEWFKKNLIHQPNKIIIAIYQNKRSGGRHYPATYIQQKG
jgi:hypothetical protein